MGKKLLKLFAETWCFWLYWLCEGFLVAWQLTGAPASSKREMASRIVSGWLVAIWVMADARRRGHTMGYGLPALVFILWPIYAPIYLFETRGSRAFLSLVGFVGMMMVSCCLGVIVAIAAKVIAGDVRFLE